MNYKPVSYRWTRLVGQNLTRFFFFFFLTKQICIGADGQLGGHVEMPGVSLACHDRGLRVEGACAQNTRQEGGCKMTPRNCYVAATWMNQVVYSFLLNLTPMLSADHFLVHSYRRAAMCLTHTGIFSCAQHPLVFTAVTPVSSPTEASFRGGQGGTGWMCSGAE